MKFDLESAITEWRSELIKSRSVKKRDIAELEDHLRSACEAELQSGREPLDAFLIAKDDIGAVAELSAEFKKVDESSGRTFFIAGWIMFLISFLLPVHHTSIKLFGFADVYGFEAFYHALIGDLGAIGVLSALTNAAMGLSFWKFRPTDRSGLVGLAGVFIAATFLNLYWLTQGGVSDLLIGYYVWWASFASIATGLILRARDTEPSESPLVFGA